MATYSFMANSGTRSHTNANDNKVMFLPNHIWIVPDYNYLNVCLLVIESVPRLRLMILIIFRVSSIS